MGFEENNSCNSFEVDELNFVSVPEFEGEARYFARPRYRSPLIPSTVCVKNGVARVKTDNAIKLVSKGQSAVFYDENGRVAFGGKICRVLDE